MSLTKFFQNQCSVFKLWLSPITIDEKHNRYIIRGFDTSHFKDDINKVWEVSCVIKVLFTKISDDVVFHKTSLYDVITTFRRIYESTDCKSDKHALKYILRELEVRHNTKHK